MEPDVDDGLTDDQRTWVAHSESLWRQAREIAAIHAGIDAGDVYHALRCLELSPTERLRQGLSRGRLRLTLLAREKDGSARQPRDSTPTGSFAAAAASRNSQQFG